METDWGTTWQALSKLWANPGPNSDAAAGAAAGAQPPGFASWEKMSAEFAAAAQAYLAAVAAGRGPAAARVLGDFLRDQFSALPSPLAGIVAPAVAVAVAVAAAPQATFADIPAFGATREHQLRWQRMLDAAHGIEEAQRRLQRLWSDALREAAAEFTQRLAPSRDGPTNVKADAARMDAPLRELYDLWIDCAEDAYARAAHTDEFCRGLADAVNAGSAVRRELQAAVEHASKLLDLPTRSEIDTLARRLRDVEAALRRQPVAASAAAAPAAPARKRRSHKERAASTKRGSPKSRARKPPGARR